MIAAVLMLAAVPGAVSAETALANLGAMVRDATASRPCRSDDPEEIVVCARPGESPHRLGRLEDAPLARSGPADAGRERDRLAAGAPRDCTRIHEGCGGTIDVGKSLSVITNALKTMLEPDD